MRFGDDGSLLECNIHPVFPFSIDTTLEEHRNQAYLQHVTQAGLNS